MRRLIGYHLPMVFLVIILVILVVIAALVLGFGMGGMRAMRQRQTALRSDAVSGQVESLRYQVPPGQDPAAVIAALKLEGFEVVRDDAALQTQDLLILCPGGAERERARVRAVIAHEASMDMEGHAMPEHEVHFADEPRTA